MCCISLGEVLSHKNATYVWVLAEARRGHLIPWNCHRQLRAAIHGYWDLKTPVLCKRTLVLYQASLQFLKQNTRWAFQYQDRPHQLSSEAWLTCLTPFLDSKSLGGNDAGGYRCFPQHSYKWFNKSVLVHSISYLTGAGDMGHWNLHSVSSRCRLRK